MTDTAPREPYRFESVPAVRESLAKVDYLADEGIAGIVYLADRLGKPVLVEGPAGAGSAVGRPAMRNRVDPWVKYAGSLGR